MHGNLPNCLSNDYIDISQLFQWMKDTGLKGETKGIIIAKQDRALNIRYYCKHVMTQGATDKCRIYHSKPETLEHIILGSQTLAPDKYLGRHNMVAAQLHLDICKHYNISVSTKCWYEHKPERIMEWQSGSTMGFPDMD